MFYILEKNLDTSGGSQQYSYVDSTHTKEEAIARVKQLEGFDKTKFLLTPYQPAPCKALVYRTEAEWEAYSWKRQFKITVG